MKKLIFLSIVLISLTTYWGCKKKQDTTTIPKTATCNDGIKNQGETGVDCGGPCADCKTLAELTTANITSVTVSSAVTGGNITSDGGSTITARGVCWNTAQNPSITENKTTDSTGTGGFNSYITGLTAKTTYYVRSYATNALGTAYGNELTFTTDSIAVDTSVTPPCSPQKNSAVFNLQQQTYGVLAGTWGLSCGNYGLVGNGTSSDLRIEFSQEPIKGKYITAACTSFMGPNECVVNGVFGGTFSYFYVANAGDTVYVIKNGTGKYSMTFCNLHFTSGSTSFTFDTDGNLTTE